MKLFLSFAFTLFLSAAAFAQTGRIAEDFSATSMQGATLNLQEQRGKIVVLTFWSTRCEICHAEIPKLNLIADKYASNPNVHFMGLSVENETKIEAYLRKKPFKFTIYPNSLGVVLKYAPKDGQGRINMGFPAYVIIDQRGEVVMDTSGWDKTGKMDATIDRLLNSRRAD